MAAGMALGKTAVDCRQDSRAEQEVLLDGQAEAHVVQ